MASQINLGKNGIQRMNLNILHNDGRNACLGLAMIQGLAAVGDVPRHTERSINEVLAAAMEKLRDIAVECPGIIML
jgi:hypothetical protein